MSGGKMSAQRRRDRTPIALVDEPGLPSQGPPTQPWDQKGSDIGGLIRPLLEALATLAGLESTYLTVFDWNRREQEVRFVFSAGESQVEEGQRIALPADLSPEAFPGVTRSPLTIGPSQPDSLVARRLGLKAYVSVPVTVAKHRLFGMLCGASRQPREVSETVVSMFESLAGIMAEHLVNVQIEATEQRATAAESQLLIRARFVAEAEHRLKTPLTALEGMSLTVRDRWEDLSASERVEFHDGIVRNARLLSDEVDGLLLEARADVRTRELRPVRLDLGPLVHDIVTGFDGIAATHHVIADVPAGIAVFVDPTAMYQVLGHLLDNAIKYSPQGGRITIRVSEAEDSVTIEVIDEGIGLPPALDVFEPFRRGELHDETTPGIGLGLHIVRNLVQAMDGTVSARTNPNAGSTFTVKVPPAHGPEAPSDPGDHPDAIITLAYYGADGRLVDSEELHVSPDAGSVWIKPSEKILSWPAVRTVRASLVRTPTTPVDIEVHLLPPTCQRSSPNGNVGHPDRF